VPAWSNVCDGRSTSISSALGRFVVFSLSVVTVEVGKEVGRDTVNLMLEVAAGRSIDVLNLSKMASFKAGGGLELTCGWANGNELQL